MLSGKAPRARQDRAQLNIFEHSTLGQSYDAKKVRNTQFWKKYDVKKARNIYVTFTCQSNRLIHEGNHVSPTIREQRGGSSAA